MKMKLTLLVPQFSKTTKYIGLSKFVQIRGVYPPLGLAYLASVLEKENHKVEIIDAEAEQLSLEQIKQRIENFNPDVIGITATDQTFDSVKRTSKFLKQNFSSLPIIIGGPVVLYYPKIIFEFPYFDYGIYGEGEKTIIPFLEALKENKNLRRNLKKVPGIIFREKNKVIINKPQKFINNLDEIPFPAWHLLPMKKYCDILAQNKEYTIMITSRGCPFNCIFCDPQGRLGRKFRFRSPKNVVDEIQLLINNHGIKEISIYDDTFTVNQERVKKICDEILKRKLKVIWECRTRVDLINKKLLQKMADAGCTRIRYGIESGNQKLLDVLKKGITLEQAKNSIKWTKEVGIDTIAYYMIGVPTETEEMTKQTINFALRLNTKFANFNITSYRNPKSELFRWGVKNNKIAKDYWDKVMRGEKVGSYYMVSDELNEEKLNNYLQYAYRKFYLRPKKLIEILKYIRKSPLPLRNYILLFFDMLIPYKYQ